MKLLQAILFSNKEDSSKFGPPLLAAFQEVESLFNQSEKYRTLCESYERFYVAEEVPTTSAAVLEASAVKDRDRGYTKEFGRFWTSTEFRGSYRGTYELAPLVRSTRALVAPDDSSPLVLITDVQISPFPKTGAGDLTDLIQTDIGAKPRYVFLSEYRSSGATINTFVISLRPLDPAFWGQHDEHPVATVKFRARAACCRATRLLLDSGINKCFTEHCYMALPLDRPERFDEMTCFCNEHGTDELVSLGFRHSSKEDETPGIRKVEGCEELSPEEKNHVEPEG